MSKDPHHPPGGGEPPGESDFQKRQAGNGNGNFALVPKPPGALEKTEPGAKRILSGMVADTLALAKKEQTTNMVFLVAVCGEHGGLYEHLLAWLHQELSGDRNVAFIHYRFAEELIEAVEQKSFDLFLIFLNPFLSRPTDEGVFNPYDLIGRLKSKTLKPIIIISNESRYGRDANPKLLEAGADAVFPMPFSFEYLGLALTACGIRLKPILSVLLLKDNSFDDLWELIVKTKFGQEYNLRFTRFENASELLSLTQKEIFDLAIIYFSNVRWDVPDRDPFDLLAGLKYGKRIIVAMGMDLSEQCAQAGVSFLDMPSTLEQLQNTIQLALKAPHPPAHESGKHAHDLSEPRPPRIVIVNDEQGPMQSMRVVLRGFTNATLSLFQDSSEAWQELSQTDPDLLITGYRLVGLSGGEILQRLLDRKATYPIIVAAAYMGREWSMRLQEFAKRGLNVTLLSLPFDIKDFKKLVEGALKNSRSKFEKVCVIPPEPHSVITQAPLSVIPPEPQNNRSLRVTIIDDYDWRTEMLGLAICKKYPNATVRTIKDGDLAWQELMREDPDLVITDVNRDNGLDGYDIVSRLATKKAQYPVLVYSGLMDKPGEDHVKRLAGPNLPVKCLYCPFTIEQFYRALSELLGSGDGPKFTKGEP